MNFKKHIKTYLAVVALFSCIPNSSLMGMQKIKTLISHVFKKNQKAQQNKQNLQQRNNAPLPKIQEKPEKPSITNAIKTSIQSFVDVESPQIEVKITQSEELKKSLAELEVAKKFKSSLQKLIASSLQKLMNQIEIQEGSEEVSIQDQTTQEKSNSEQGNSLEKNSTAVIDITEKNEKDDIVDIQENSALTELEKTITEEENQFFKNIMKKNNEELPKTNDQLFMLVFKKTQDRIDELKKIRKEFIQKTLSNNGIQAQEVKGSHGKQLLRLVKIGGKWAFVASAGWFATWALLMGINQIPYVEYLIPDAFFNLVGPFAVPKIMWCMINFPVRLLGSYLNPHYGRTLQTLKSLSEACKNHAKVIAEKIVEFNSGVGQDFLNIGKNPCADNLSNVKHLVSPAFKKAIESDPTHFINMFSKILTEKYCLDPEKLMLFTPTSISPEILSEALEAFKPRGLIPPSYSVWGSITQMRFSDFISW